MTAHHTDRACCCNVVTAAGLITSLQMVVLVIAMASTGLVLDRYRLWETYEPQPSITTPDPTTNGTVKTLPNIWAKAFVELGMAWYIAFGSFWLFSLVIMCFSFKYYRPVFVLPNFIALIVGIFMNAFGFAVILGRILYVSKPYRTIYYEDAMLVYVMAYLLFVFIINFVFLFFVSKYHKYLGHRYGSQIPKFIQPRPKTHRSVYPDEY
uniref:Uncharacterized protein n=1 Tax=Acrobeloides nanus TaxID=290746 RepID=A0A914DQ89_9BILA